MKSFLNAGPRTRWARAKLAIAAEVMERQLIAILNEVRQEIWA
jgi:hypothetical protein